MEWLSITAGPIVALLAAGVGFLVYRRSLVVDKLTEQSRVASAQVGAVQQVIEGLNKLIDNLQEDNKALRADIHDLNSRIREMRNTYETLEDEVRRLKNVYNVLLHAGDSGIDAARAAAAASARTTYRSEDG